MKASIVGRAEKKVVLVTGGASGLGLASAERLAEEGAKIVISDVQDPLSNSALERIRTHDPNVRYLHHDVAQETDWQSVIVKILDQHGRLDGLVNNAGIGGNGGPIHEMTLDSWRRMQAVNLDGVFLGVKYGIKTMLENGGAGSIVNLSSILGLIGIPNAAAYAASKGGVKLMTKVAALECAARGDNIRVNSVHPGFIDTPMVQSGIQRSGDEMRQFILAAQPTNQMGEPMDIANGVVFLISDESKFMTGSELVIDGGYTAR
jgi:NAD(P)-dependent dehydrogenase (short-subunit alcohol dehydrogenase family)